MGDLLIKLVLTKTGQTTRTYDNYSTTPRLLNVAHSETPYSQEAVVVVDNGESDLTSLDLRGYKGVLSYGYTDPTAGDEYSATAPLWVIAERLDSWRGGLAAVFSLIGTPDLMERDHASEAHNPDFTDTRTVKEILREVAKGGWTAWAANTAYVVGDFIIPTTSNGLVYKCTTGGTSGGTEPATWATTEGNTTTDNTVTWTCRGVEIKGFRHTTAYTITFDSEDSLIDVFQPKDSFRILLNDTRLSVIKKLMAYTKCAFRVEDDEELHVFTPTTTGTTYNYEYQLNVDGQHTFFSKSHRKRIVIPNYIVVKSHPDHADQYSGFDEDTDSSALLAKREYHYMRLASNAQATTMATAILARYQLNAEGGSGVVPMNVGQEVFDYIKFTDSRDNGDTRIGNIGYLKRTYTARADPPKFEMELRFGESFVGLGDVAMPSMSRGTSVLSSSGATGVEAVWEVVEKTWGFLERVVNSFDALKAQVSGEIEGLKTRKEDAFAWMLPVSSQTYSLSLVFSATDFDTITWTAGTVQLADGRSQAVDSGSLNLTTIHYLYVIWGNRTLQNTTTYSTAVGSDKVLLGIATKATTTDQKAYILIPHTDNVLINIDKLGVASQIFGDGSDGDVTIAADTSLTRDMFYDNLTVNATKTLSPAGYRIFVKGTLTNNGIIARDGNAGGAGGNGQNGAELSGGTGGTAGTAGSALTAANLPGSPAGQAASAGGNGGTGGVGSPGTAGTIGSSQSKCIGGNGTAGGASGAGGASIIGGYAGGAAASGGGAGTATATVAAPRGVPAAILMTEVVNATIAAFVVSAGSGSGASGGGGGTGLNGSTYYGGGGGGGGGSGSPGGVIVLCAKTIANSSGIIRANGGVGGKGGNGGNGYIDSGAGGGGGGGAGGNGGVLILIYNTLTTGTETANGGTGGARGDAGTGGAGGAANGAAGADGGAGVKITIANV